MYPQDSVALVTGAAGGIGSAISRALAAQGARVALSGTNAAKLRAYMAAHPADQRKKPSAA